MYYVAQTYNYFSPTVKQQCKKKEDAIQLANLLSKLNKQKYVVLEEIFSTENDVE